MKNDGIVRDREFFGLTRQASEQYDVLFLRSFFSVNTVEYRFVSIVFFFADSVDPDFLDCKMVQFLLTFDTDRIDLFAIHAVFFD